MKKFLKVVAIVLVGGVLTVGCKNRADLADGVESSFYDAAIHDDAISGENAFGNSEVGLNDNPLLPGNRQFKAFPASEQTWPKVYFANNQYNLSSESQQKLASLGQYLASNPTYVVVVEGHCSITGSDEYNRVLSEKRAQAAKQFLIAQGVNGDNVDTVAYGKEKPAIPGDSSEAHAQNRRDEFILGTR